MTVRIEDIDAVLPQTQCGECGYPGCKPYATAIIEQNAALNLCPPGSVATMKQLGQLLQQDVSALEAEMLLKTRKPVLARIVEQDCIGCTKCIQACPVDAIIGAAKSMHVVITDECTGCGLCVEPCPVDCIILDPITTPHYQREQAKNRFEARQSREQQRDQAKRHEQALAQQRSYIEAAILRSKNKKGMT